MCFYKVFTSLVQKRLVNRNFYQLSDFFISHLGPEISYDYLKEYIQVVSKQILYTKVCLFFFVNTLSTFKADNEQYFYFSLPLMPKKQ